MATRFYFGDTGQGIDLGEAPFTPTPQAGWESTDWAMGIDDVYVHLGLMKTVQRLNPLTTLSFVDASAVNQDVLFYQWIGDEMTPGQVIAGFQSIKFQGLVLEDDSINNMRVALGLRILDRLGTTVRKTLIAVSRAAVEADPFTLVNRQWSTLSASGDYTTVFGDRVVLEIGMGGDPAVGGTHSSSMRFGDAAVSDLPIDNTTTTDLNPWMEMSELDLTFVPKVIIKGRTTLAGRVTIA